MQELLAFAFLLCVGTSCNCVPSPATEQVGVSISSAKGSDVSSDEQLSSVAEQVGISNSTAEVSVVGSTYWW